MGEKYKGVRANGFYVRSSEDGEVRVTKEASKLKEVTRHWSNGLTIMAINEALHQTESLEEKVELLQFKSDILENATFGKNFSICDD